MASLKRVGHALGSLLEGLLVGLDETAGFVAEGEGQSLQATKIHSLAEDDGSRDLVKCCSKFFMRNHLADNGGDFAVRKLEHGSEGVHRDCVVEGCICE
jgi:hypothetical protein